MEDKLTPFESLSKLWDAIPEGYIPNDANDWYDNIKKAILVLEDIYEEMEYSYTNWDLCRDKVRSALCITKTKE